MTGTTTPTGMPQVEHVTYTAPAGNVGRATAITSPAGIPTLSDVHAYTAPVKTARQKKTQAKAVSPIPTYGAQPKNNAQAKSMAAAGWRG